MANGIRTDKLDTCAALLEDCIVGFFAGNSIQTTTNLAFAVMTMVRDIHGHYQKTLKDDWTFTTVYDRQKDDPLVKSLYQRNKSLTQEYNFSLIDRANFVKHANENPLDDAIFLGNEDGLILLIAIEDFGSLYTALSERKLCCQVSDLFGLPDISVPKFFKLAALFCAYEKEYNDLKGSVEVTNDYKTSLIPMEELKTKYFDIIQQWGIARGRSQYDQLVLIDSLDINKNPKPTGPVQSRP